MAELDPVTTSIESRASGALAPAGDGAGAIAAGQRPRRRRARWWGVAVAALALVVGGLWWLGSRVESPAARAAKAAPPTPSLVTAKVERRVLAESVVTRGDVRPSGASQVSWSGGGGAGAAGAVVTGVPVRAGGQVSEGQVVVEVSGRPVLAIAGGVPVFRDLRPGLSGKDVAQLQAALTRLGFAGVESDGVFGPGTKAAVAAWYQQTGYQAPLTSADAAAQLTTASNAVTAARQKLTDAQAVLAKASKPATESARLQADAQVAAARRALDSAKLQARQDADDAAATLAKAQGDLAAAQGAGDSAAIAAAQAALTAAQTAKDRVAQASDAAVADATDALKVAEAAYKEATAKPDVTAEERAVDDATAAVDDAEKAFAALDAVTGSMVPASELIAVAKLPARVDTVSAAVGAKADGVLVSMSVDAFVVESLLTPANKPLVHAGAAVTIDDELTGLTYRGKVESVADELTVPTGESAGGASGYLARVVTDSTIDPKLLGANVRVTIAGQSSGGEVLVVPVAAVFAQADGSNRVTRVAEGAEQPVAVDTGLAAGGFVAITSSTPELAPGDDVVVGR